MSLYAELTAGRHGDPFSILGPHRAGDRTLIRTFQPGARRVVVLATEIDEELGPLRMVDPAGLFEGEMSLHGPYRLRIEWPGGVSEQADPYAFGLLLGPLDMHLFAEGRHRELATCLGAHRMTVEGVDGVRFAVWAPNARRVSVIGDFNGWDGRRHPMRLRREAGIWELFLPGVHPGAHYKYEILAPDGALLPLKADPVAAQTELPPATASVVAHDWPPPEIERPPRDRAPVEAPVSIYEVHAGSWMRAADGSFLSWDALADKLVPYVAEMGFSHIELLPISEYPFDGSWGYQPTGMFAPSARFGHPEGFARFVARAHAEGLGVLLDWVPGHFPNDPHGLVRFDGTALYEHVDPREGFHPDWNTMIYNYGRIEVREFLIASALHWLRRFGCDGIRVDAVASMLYRDYSRQPGEWLPNVFGGRENLEAVAFLQELNREIGHWVPEAITVAEESTAWPGVSASVDHGGLGFHFKWNMGWMHDTLRYMSREPIHRRYHHNDMTFGLVYAFSERFILPLSHDEVVHGKGSLLNKMPGDRWQKFANLRAYFGFMFAHPGKKLLFMGSELAQPSEWSHQRALDWHLLDDPAHAGIQRLVRALNHLYADTPALHRRDASPDGFRWIIGDDAENSVFAFLRLGGTDDPPVLAVSNFTPVMRHGYRIGVPAAGRWREALNTDAAVFGGSNVGNQGGAATEAVPSHGHAQSLSLTLPPLATLFLLHRPG
jgi:1,4-alpha-glucan branching enzyme